MTPEEEQIINETCQKAADRIEELEAQLSSKEQECERLKVKLNLAESSNSEFIKKIEFYKSTVSPPEYELSSLRAEIEKWRTESISVRAENERLNGHIKLLKEMYELIKNENGQLKSDLYHAQSNLELSDKRCEDLEAKVISRDKIVNNYGLKGRELQKRVEDLEAVLDRNGLSWTYKKLSQ